MSQLSSAWQSRSLARNLKELVRLAVKRRAQHACRPTEHLALAFRAPGGGSVQDISAQLAVAAEAAKRALNLDPFPVQLAGASALFSNTIAEMKTGEGKTLVVALAASVAALRGRGVHVAVPNQYLADRDAELMRPLYETLGLTVGVNRIGSTLEEKKAAYVADITYGVHSEFGFDYLRDHLAAEAAQQVQRGHAFAIVDEADLILIDEARTPMVLSLPGSTDPEDVSRLCRAVAELPAELVQVDENQKSATLTEEGMGWMSRALTQLSLIANPDSLYAGESLLLLRQLDAAVRARFVYHRDQDYLLDSQGTVQIIDSSTGRVLGGRRWQAGLHQAIEAKEGVSVQPEFEVGAEIAYQSYFGLYSHLCGLTGTAIAAKEEFERIYGRTVRRIATNRLPMREDFTDLLYPTRIAKYRAIVDDVLAQLERGRPVLVGTGTLEESEALSAWFDWAAIPHKVLNAKTAADEASIIAEAGLPRRVTIATSMAGRGTDILLGGPRTGTPDAIVMREDVLHAGGLHIIGTERQASRRVDDQLIGRAGRQGEPGSSRFYLSLEDDLLRLNGGAQLAALGELLGSKQGEGVSSPLITRAVKAAQARIENRHLNERLQRAQTDGPLTQQRMEVYALRDELVRGELGAEFVAELIAGAAREQAKSYVSPEAPALEWEVLTLKAQLRELWGVDLPVFSWVKDDPLIPAARFLELVGAEVARAWRAKRENDVETLSNRERIAVLAMLDIGWRELLTVMDEIRDGIHLRSYAQENPAYAFSRESFSTFTEFRRIWRNRVANALLRPEVDATQPVKRSSPAKAPVRAPSRLSRCQCGSGKYVKHCHGALEKDWGVLAWGVRAPLRAFIKLGSRLTLQAKTH